MLHFDGNKIVFLPCIFLREAEYPETCVSFKHATGTPSKVK